MKLQHMNNIGVSMAVIQKTVRESAKNDQQDAQKVRSSKFSQAIGKKKESAVLSRKKADKDVEALEENAEGSFYSGVWTAVGALAGIAAGIAAVAGGPITAVVLGVVAGLSASGVFFSKWQAGMDEAEKKAEAAEFQQLAAEADVAALDAEDKADRAKNTVSDSRDRMRQSLDINRTILSYQNNTANQITGAVGSGGRA
jgi:hypothetical protein